MTEQLATPTVPDFPRISARFARDGDRVELQVMDTEHTFDTDHHAPARVAALNYVSQVAAEFKRPVRVKTTAHGSPGGNLIVTPDGAMWDEADPGHVYDIDQLTTTSRQSSHSATVDPSDGSTEGSAQVGGPVELDTHPGHDLAPPDDGLDLLLGSYQDHYTSGPDLPDTTDPTADRTVDDPEQDHDRTPQHLDPTTNLNSTPQVQRNGGPEAGAKAENKADEKVDREPGRRSFLQTEVAVAPARHGWRGALNRLGLTISPGPDEVDWRHDVEAVSQHWPGPRTIAVANPKGSANKTPTSALLAAVFARYGGAGVVAWDNNETRGSLAWRTQSAAHDATVLDLLPRVGDLLAAGAQAAELSHFTHHQLTDKYDVLASDQSVASAHEVSAADVDHVHQVLSRYYRLIVMDSGNSERAANWRAMVEHSAALVVPCTNSLDTPEAGRLMLESLRTRDAHCDHLATNAVAIVSQRDHTRTAKKAMDHIVAGMGQLTAEVIVIPFDPAMKEGVLQFDALRPATQRAWLRAAAAVARRL